MPIVEAITGSVVFAFLKKFKWVFISLGVVGLLTAGYFYVKITSYNAGKNECISRMLQEQQKIIHELEEKYRKTHDTTEKQRNKIRSSIKKNPINDARDSCLLSGDPFRAECQKYLE